MARLYIICVDSNSPLATVALSARDLNPTAYSESLLA